MQGNLIIFTNDAQAPFYAHSSGYACVLGEYSGSGTSRLHDINLKITAANTGAKVLYLNNVDDSTFDLNVNDGALYVGNSYPNKEAVVYGVTVGDNILIKGNISDLPSASNLTGTVKGNYLLGTSTGLITNTINATSIKEGGTDLSAKYATLSHNHDNSYIRKNGGGTGSLMYDNLNIYQNKLIELGYAYTKETNAGKIGYGAFIADELAIVGAGIEGVKRKVRVYDNLYVDYGCHIVDGFQGLYLWGDRSKDYKWNINHDLAGETANNCGNLNFYADMDGANSLIQVAYLEDDIGAGGRKLNFTGSHRVVEARGDTKIDLTTDVGLIVVASGEYCSLFPTLKKNQKENITIDEALPTVKLCSKKKDKRVLGVVCGEDTLSKDKKRRVWHQGNFKSVMRKAPNDDRFEINALGEGAVWVCDLGGSFENGDFITTSSLNGYGEKQDDDLVHNYTLGKITCDVDWNDRKLDEKFQTRTVNGRKCAFVGCIYLCG